MKNTICRRVPTLRFRRRSCPVNSATDGVRSATVGTKGGRAVATATASVARLSRVAARPPRRFAPTLESRATGAATTARSAPSSWALTAIRSGYSAPLPVGKSAAACAEKLTTDPGWSRSFETSFRNETRMSWPCSGSSSATPPSSRRARPDSGSRCLLPPACRRNQTSPSPTGRTRHGPRPPRPAHEGTPQLAGEAKQLACRATAVTPLTLVARDPDALTRRIMPA